MTGPTDSQLRELGKPAALAAGDWSVVPVGVFAGGEAPAFALFDRRRRVADLRIARSVYVSEGDREALDRYLARRLSAIEGISAAGIEARAWALHRTLIAELTGVLDRLPDKPDYPQLLRRLTELSRLAVEWMPEHSAPYLAQLVYDDQRAPARGVITAFFALTLCAAQAPGDADTQAAIVLASLLADVGKLTMPEAILSKSGPLSPDEWELTRRHPERSIGLLMRAGVRSVPTLRAVRWHHERWGGGGYPDNLRGNEIPIEARILGIADAFAALTVDRPHTMGVRAYDALTEMARSQGQFDPRLLRTFVTTMGAALPADERWGAA